MKSIGTLVLLFCGGSLFLSKLKITSGTNLEEEKAAAAAAAKGQVAKARVINDASAVGFRGTKHHWKRFDTYLDLNPER